MRKEPGDYLLIPEAKSKGGQQRSNLSQESVQDFEKQRGIRSLQEDVDQLKLENYHLKAQLEELGNNQPGHPSLQMRVQQLEEQNLRLKASLASRESNQSKGGFQERYNKALIEISKLLKSNGQLRTQFQYMKQSMQTKKLDPDLIEQLRRMEQHIEYLQQTNQQLKFRLQEDQIIKNKPDLEDNLEEALSRLKEREMDVEQLRNHVEESQAKYLENNIRFQNLINDSQQRYAQLQKDSHRRELELRQDLEDSDARLRESEIKLEEIRSSAGYLHFEMGQLKEQLERMEILNQQLRREVRQESSASESSMVGELKSNIRNLASEMENLRHQNFSKDNDGLLAQNQMLQRQLLIQSTKSFDFQKQLAQTKIHLQEYTRKHEAIKSKLESIQQANSQLQVNLNLKEQKIIKMDKQNGMLKERIMNPDTRKAVADMQEAEDIDIDELKYKVRSCTLILQLMLSDHSSPKEVEVEQLQQLKTLLVEIDIKTKVLIEDNHTTKKLQVENLKTISELEDVNARLAQQSSNYQGLIQHLEEEFQKSINRNELMESNLVKELKVELENLTEQTTISIKHLKQELETRTLDFGLQLVTVKNGSKRTQMSLHSAYQQKQADLTNDYRNLDRAHNEAIRQLRLLGPEKEQTISRLYSSINDLELQLKMYKNQNEIGQGSIQELLQEIKAGDESNLILQNNIKVVLTSQKQRIEQLENYKLTLKDYGMKIEAYNAQVEELSERLKTSESNNIALSSQLQIIRQEASEFFYRGQAANQEANLRATEYNRNVAQSNSQLEMLRKRVQSALLDKHQTEELKLKQEKNFNTELGTIRRNYQQRLDIAQKNYQESVKAVRVLEGKVDDLTLMNIQLFNQARYRPDEDIMDKRSSQFEDRLQRNNQSFNLSGFQGEQIQHVQAYSNNQRLLTLGSDTLD